jgi:5,5'-dehydrodivanillate O-demethylase
MLSIKLPVDDFNTKRFCFLVHLDQPTRDDWSPEPVEDCIMPPSRAKTPVGARHPEARHNLTQVPFQDIMVIETQGAISNRPAWHGGTRDSGVATFDSILLREIDKVERGIDPLGVVRDPTEVIDTNVEEIHLVGMR